MTDFQQEYKELWLLIDSIDAKHAESGQIWQLKEIEHVIKQVEKICFKDIVSDLKYTKEKIESIVNRFHKSPNDIDFITMNVLKDRIHKIWTWVEPSEEKENFSEIYESKPKSFFTRKEFRKIYRGHGKKNEEETKEEREAFLYNALKSMGLHDGFHLYLHDVANSSRMGHVMLSHIPLLMKYKKKGIISEQAMESLILKVTECSIKFQQSHEGTYNVDELYNTLDISLKYLDGIFDYETDKRTWNNGYDLTEEEIYNSINCKLSNCNVRVKLSDSEKSRILNGFLIQPKRCVYHMEHDGYGHMIDSEKIRSFTKILPKTPIVLRMVGVTNDSFFCKKLRDRIIDFIANSKETTLLKEHKESFIDGHMSEDRKTRTNLVNVMYLKFESDSELKRFHTEFNDDIASGYYPEIMKGGMF